MVQEQPPRRSKAVKKPVTIDLAAEESQVFAEPVRSNDADEAVTQAEAAQAEAAESVPVPSDHLLSDHAASAGTPSEEARSETPSTADSALDDTQQQPIETEAEDGKTGAEAPSQAASFERGAYASGSAADTAPSDHGTSAHGSSDHVRFDSEPASSATMDYSTPPSATARGRAGPSVSAMVASGIFGGIVALLLAGSMQYAGYLPAAGGSRGAGDPADASQIIALQQEVDALKQRPAGDETLAQRVQSLEQQAQSGGTADDLQQRFAALEKQLQEVRSATEATAGNDAELARRLNEAEAKINDRGPEQQAARAVAAAALKAAIDRGGSFEPELQTFANISAGDPAVAQLQPFAASGAPSRAELQREIPAVADAMVEAVEQPDPNQGLAARLFSSALSVVKVRQVGQVEGTTPQAVVARIEDAVRGGDLASAAREWDALPPAAKTAGEAFKSKLDARIQVENLVGGTLTRAVAGTQG